MFKNYINQKFLDFERRSGSRKTVTEFATDIGENQGNVSHWLNGTRTPQGTVLARLQKTWGDEVYAAALPIEIMPDEPVLRRAVEAMKKLPPQLREQIAEAAERYAQEAEREQAVGNRPLQLAV